MLKYWTTRYVSTLFIGLLILGVFSLWWIRHNTIENRLTLMEYTAAETADRIGLTDRRNDFNSFNRRLDDRAKLLQMKKPPELFITNLNGNILNARSPHRGRLPNEHPLQSLKKIPAKILDTNETIQKVKIDSKPVYVVKKPIMFEGNQAGWVVVVQTASQVTNVNQEYRFPIFLLVGIGLLGWIVIYFLSKKIVKPIQDVARAASQIKDGNYDINLNTHAKEKELYELLTSFEEMTSRLSHLEKLRAELLAGVTHDLKTPVTSISGLVQAVKDGVVSGEERNEFLEITLKEVNRLQRMIEDLLDYNSLSAGAFSIRSETCHFNEMVEDIVHQWKMTQNEDIDIEVILPRANIYRETDPLRLQQILINLFNNSYHSIDSTGSITVTLTENSIDVQDTGSGIPEKEQPYVFERFFRGEKKKLKVRGLGLGLPFSKMLAKALGADLVLKESSLQGSTFSMVWKK
nr:HAMP domain-containing sensor histidine kinase [Fictibacillus nanhaiensis]